MPFRTKCYLCGNDACPACSALVKWNGRHVRACADCIHDRREDRDLVVGIGDEIRLGLAKDALRQREIGLLPNLAGDREFKARRKP